MRKRTFEDVVNGVATQTSQWELRFQEPVQARGCFFFLAMCIGLINIYLYRHISFSTDAKILALIFTLLFFQMLFLSLRHEMHLNFHYRAYNQIVGIGKLCRSQTGTFDEITSVYIIRSADNKSGTIYHSLGLCFGELSFSVVPLPFQSPYKRPKYHLMTSSEASGEAIIKYAQDLAMKIGCPYQYVDRAPNYT